MGIWLLAIESLIISLLWLAMGMAWRARQPRGRGLVVVLMFLAPLTVYLILLGSYLVLNSKAELNRQMPYVLALLIGGYLLGTIFLWHKARQPVAEAGELVGAPGSTLRQANRWPAGKLAMAMLVGLLLHAMTFWNLDTAMQHRLEALRVEAGAKALAVLPGKPADRENAGLIYEQAFARLTKYEQLPDQYQNWTDKKYVASHPDLFEDTKLLAFLKSNAQTIALLNQAGKFPACSFDRNYAEPNMAMPIPEVGTMRQAAQLLMLQAQVDAAQGNLHAAIEHIQTIYMMGEHVNSDPLLISMLVSFALDSMATETLQSVLSGKQPTLEELAPLDFGPPNATSRRLVRALRMEEAFGLATFGQMATQPDIWGMIGAITTDGETNTDYAWIFSASLALYRVLLLEDDVESYRALHVKYHELAPLSPAAARGKADEADQELATRSEGLLTQILVPALKTCFMVSGRHAAKRETAKTGIAIHRYRAEHDKLPKQLADLVPEYLPAIPLDPYTDKPLKYKVTSDDWVVYSIGEDLKDNGGAAYDDKDHTGDIGFYAVKPVAKVEPTEHDEN